MWKLYVCLLGYLGLESDGDIHRKQISVIRSVFLGIVACMMRGWMGQPDPGLESLRFLAGAMLPGGILLIIAKITRQAVGYGDGILLTVCGLCLGGKIAVLLFVTGLWLLFPVSMVLLLSGRAGRRDELPFAPFLLAAYLLWLAQL